MKLGIPVTAIGVLGIVIGGAMYAAKYHRTIGLAGIILGAVLFVIGILYWAMKERKASEAKGSQQAMQQPAQPAATTTASLTIGSTL